MWTDYRSGFRATRRGEQAVEAFREADQIDQLPRQVRGDDEVYLREAEKFRTLGSALLQPTGPIQVSHGEAISPDTVESSFKTALIVETLEKHPTTIAVGASEKRCQAVERADVLEPALDAAQSAQAANSLEKMLCHQMAAAHFTVMRLLTTSEGDKLQAGEVVKLTNAAARMMEVYQNASLTLQKLKTRGTQRIEVRYQQVNVGSGGQAVVAGAVRGGSCKRRGGRKNAR